MANTKIGKKKFFYEKFPRANSFEDKIWSRKIRKKVVEINNFEGNIFEILEPKIPSNEVVVKKKSPIK